MILHFSHMGFTDGLTFMSINLHYLVRKIIRRKGRVMVICENPKHKQRQG